MDERRCKRYSKKIPGCGGVPGPIGMKLRSLEIDHKRNEAELIYRMAEKSSIIHTIRLTVFNDAGYGSLFLLYIII